MASGHVPETDEVVPNDGSEPIGVQSGTDDTGQTTSGVKNGEDVIGTSPELEQEESDDVDGLISKFMNQGHYCPRSLEKKAWGPNVGNLPLVDDPQELLYLLIKTTNAARWRSCLAAIFESCQTEEEWKQALGYLISVVRLGIRRAQAGSTTSFPLYRNIVPSHVSGTNLQLFLTGVMFSVAKESDNQNIDELGRQSIHVSVGKDVSLEAVRGLAHFLTNIVGLPFRIASELFGLGRVKGEQLFQSLNALCEGCGIDDTTRPQLDDLCTQHASVMAACGFRWSVKSPLAWQRPTCDVELFEALFSSLHGLYRDPVNIQLQFSCFTMCPDNDMSHVYKQLAENQEHRHLSPLVT